MTHRALSSWLRLPRPFALALLCSMSTACGTSGSSELGRAEVTVRSSAQALSANDVGSVSVSVTGSGIGSPITQSLTRSGVQWQGTIAQIPVGIDRLFHADAFDATAANVLYSGDTPNVVISAGQTAVVVMMLQQTTPPTPFVNMAPHIDALYVSSAEVEPGQTVSLQVYASDPDVGDTLTYEWSGPGTFSAAAGSQTSWTAPGTEGTYTLSARVTDSKGASAGINFQITVASIWQYGSASVSASLNAWPEVARVTADQTQLVDGQSTTFHVQATDPDGDALSYTWSSSCPATITGGDTADPTFTLQTTSVGTCTMHVSVSDGRGGTNSGELTFHTGPAVTPTVGNGGSGTTSNGHVYLSQSSSGVGLVVDFDTSTGTYTVFRWASSGEMPIIVADFGSGIRIRTAHYGVSTGAPGNEYLLSGAITGLTSSLVLPYGTYAFDAAYDGTNIYLVHWMSGAVYKYGRNYEGGTFLFSASQNDLGITYDSGTGTLWFANWSNGTITQRSLTGTVLASFSAGTGNVSALSYDNRDGTLWLADASSTHTLKHFTRSGTVLGSFPLPFAVLGGEMNGP